METLNSLTSISNILIVTLLVKSLSFFLSLSFSHTHIQIYIYIYTHKGHSMNKLNFTQGVQNRKHDLHLQFVFFVFVNGPVDVGSIPGGVIPKTLKMVLDTSLLSTQQ